jgi:hypothetical protein
VRVVNGVRAAAGRASVSTMQRDPSQE